MPTHDEAHAAWQARLLTASFDPDACHDWPGRRCATIYLLGCPWRCVYCHNPRLQTRRRQSGGPDWGQISRELESLRGEISGVVFSGGEPTADAALPEALAAVRAMGFPVGLHTSGAYPERLERVLPLLDWIGFDLKADYEGYEAVTATPGSAARATRSARLVVASGVTHEFRLTWHHEALNEDSARLAAHFAHHLGARHFVLQTFRREGVDNPALAAASEPPASLIRECAGLFGDAFTLRREICGLAGA
ncbi:anaerobic ribonucleoside-triphosphate reductase activating protein [Uliginosibacterium paludis]|uniref:Anaerobic ribonucleoside-triphosphate reductase activating protein n=1 Tax=Uliginosibacterium paludis TaxID=1615952 RepID=A0ABV2CMY9_9RHOO